MIEVKIRRAGLSGVLGPAGESNLQGETQLDVYANQVLLHCLGVRDKVVALVLEENGPAVMFDRSLEAGRHVIVFDPLDGSKAGRSITFVPQAYGLLPDQNVPAK